VKVVGILVGTFLFVVAVVCPTIAAPRPNLLVLSIDTLRADHVGCYGYSLPTTPSIDSIARNGTRFDLARSVSPWTLPSFASMFTGRYPTRHGAGARGPLRDISHETPQVIAPGVPTLAERLRDSGYRTAAITSNPYLRLGPLRGFQTSIAKAVRADRIGSLSRSWIQTNARKQPWALWVHFNDPHEPTKASNSYLRALGYGRGVINDPRRKALERWGDDDLHLGRSQTTDDVASALRTKVALYDASIRQVDTEIGRILELLHRRGVLRNTLVVVVSDHGEEFHDHVEAERAWAADPRGITGIGHGHTLYDEQLRVPLILMGPGVGVRDVIAEQIPLVDLMPTVLGLLRVEAPTELDGQDRRSWIKARQRAPLPMLAEGLAYGPDRVGYCDGRYKLIADRSGHALRLFDLVQDPLELNNAVALIDSLPWATAMRDSLVRWSGRLLMDAPADVATDELSDEMREGLKSLGYVK
jgi:arylsulfatase A-like enzyme